MMRDEDLYPCPYCRSEQVELETADGWDWFVDCMNCGATGPWGDTRDQAGERYNQLARPLAEQQAAKLKP